MKNVSLETIGIEVQLKRNQEIYNTGFVKDIMGAVEYLSESYGDFKYCNYLYATQLLAGRIPTGGCLIFKMGIWPFQMRHIHILYEDQKDEILNLGVMAHEETHAADEIHGGLRVLEQKMAFDGFRLKASLKKFDKETRARVGELYVLLARGFSIQDIKAKLPEFVTRELELFAG